jgi:hypothetical protein
VTHKGAIFCAIPLKKVKSKVKNQGARNCYETIRGSPSKKDLSIHTTNSPSQSCEAVPLRRLKVTLLYRLSRGCWKAAFLLLLKETKSIQIKIKPRPNNEQTNN